MAFKVNLSRFILFIISVAVFSSFKAIFIVQLQVEQETIEPLEDQQSHVTVGSAQVDSNQAVVDPQTVCEWNQSTSEDLGPEEEEEEEQVDLSSLYNVTGCPVDFLGLTQYAASKLCANQTPEVCLSLTCRSLLAGTGKDLYYGAARLLMSARPSNSKGDAYFIDATKDCEAFKRERGYHLTPLSAEEAAFPLAFNLIVHTNAEQVEGQLRALYRPQNRFCIHVDAKAEVNFTAAMTGIARCFENVFIASKLERLTWGGYNRLQADINCMRDHLKDSSSAGGPQWKYLINTAGLAFPLKTIGEMVKTLKIYNGANDIEGIYGHRVIRSRFEKEWQEDENRGIVVNTGRKNSNPPHNISIVKGSAYGVFSRDFVRFVLEDRKAVDLLKWSRKTWSPDEMYWATLHHTYSNPHLNTPGGYSGYPSDKPWLAAYANWGDAENKCRGKRVRSVCVFGVGDLPNLSGRREFFANKFHSNFEPLALQCLSAWIRQKEVCPPAFDDEFYRSLPFIKRTS